MRRLFAVAVTWAVAILNAVLPTAAQSETWPSKPIKIISGYSPGGTVDAVARLVAPHLQQRVGQPVVVENRVGAGGTIGADYVAKSPKDGYVLLLGAAGNVTSAASLYKALPYNPLKDLAPVALATRVSNILVAHPKLGVKSVKELVERARAEPGKLAYGSGGVGTSLHLAGEQFKLMAGVDIVHVPYKGSGPVVTDLISGQLLLAFADSGVIEHVRAGRLLALGQTAGTRQEQLKDVPTINEAGVTGYDSINWQGFFLPAGTPQPIIARLNSELTAVLKLDEVRTRIEGLGLSPATSTPEEFQKFLAADLKLWADVITKANITVDP